MPQYTALAKNEIRLLILHPGTVDEKINTTLKTTTLFLPSPEPYLALSYAWGDANDVERIDCNGAPTNVTSSLAHALRYIRLEDERITLWVDAVCISQADLDERNQQVALMRHIFVKADKVIIWVGEADDTTGDVMQWFKDLDKHFEDETPSVELEYIAQSNDFQQRLASVRSFVSRPWFHRSWTFQEACLANSAYIQCGHLTLPWLTLCAASILARNMGIDVEAFGDATAYVASLAYYSVMTHVEGDDFRFGTLLRETRSRIATDSRDKIYSILGLLPAIKVVPDYKLSVQQIYCETARGIIATDQSLAILSDSNGGGNSNDLPSWVPDWRQPLQSSPLCRHRDDQGTEGGVGPLFAVNASHDKFSMSDQVVDITRLEVQGHKAATVSHVWSLERLADDLRRSRQDWRTTIQQLSDFLKQACLPDTYSCTNESSRIAFLRTLSADTLPVSDRVGVPLKQKKFPWHHDWFRQEIDIDLKIFRRHQLLKHFGIDSWRTRSRYQSKAFDMSKRIQQVYEGLFNEVLEGKALRTRGWTEGLLRTFLRESRPTESYFWHEDITPRVVNEMVDSILEWIRGRSFIVTDDGLMGMAPARVVPGDPIYRLCGARVPFLLRSNEVEAGTWKLLGECYLHGIMYGEESQRKSKSNTTQATSRLQRVILI